MNKKIIALGGSIEHCLMESFPTPFLEMIFSEDMGLDDLVDQVIIELIKFAYEQKQEKHPLIYYLSQLGEVKDQSGEVKDDLRMKYSRLIKISNAYKEKELDALEKSLGVSMDHLRPPKMQEIEEKLEGYQLSEMDFKALSDIDELLLVKAIINHRLGSVKKIPNPRFVNIAQQYDKRVVSLMEQSCFSDDKMIRNSLSYFILEWRYAFNFIYSCAVYMNKNGITDPKVMFLKVNALFGIQSLDCLTGEKYLAVSRMIGFREKMIAMAVEDDTFMERYSQLLTIMTVIKEKGNINGVPITQWFIENTDENDWASFFREYDVFRCVHQKKDYSKQIIRNMRGLIDLIFPEESQLCSGFGFEKTELLPSDATKSDDYCEKQDDEGSISMSRIACYIEEYRNDRGLLCARLRDKESNRRIIILGDDIIKAHLLRFLSAAKKHLDIMPTVYDREGTDIVAVRGAIKNEDSESIEVDIAVLGAGYLFE